MKRVGKSVLAVVAGFAAFSVFYFIIGVSMYRYADNLFLACDWRGDPLCDWAGLAMEYGRLLASVILGGFVASRIAGRTWVWHAGVFGALILGLMIPQRFNDPQDFPRWYYLGMLASIEPVALLGGWLSFHRRGSVT